MNHLKRNAAEYTAVVLGTIPVCGLFYNLALAHLRLMAL